MLAIGVGIGLLMGAAAPAHAQEQYLMPLLTVLEVAPPAGSSMDTQRNTAIAWLSAYTADSVQFYQSQNNAQLADHLSYAFFILSRGVKYSELKGISAGNMRNTAIVIINRRTNIPVSELQGLSAQPLLAKDYFDAQSMKTSLDHVASRSDLIAHPIAWTTDECKQIEDAKTQLAQVAPTLAGKLNEYHSVMGKIDQVLAPLRKLGPLYDAAVATNAALAEYERQRGTLLGEIRALEAQQASLQAFLRGGDVLNKCLSCQYQRSMAQSSLQSHAYASQSQKYTEYYWASLVSSRESAKKMSATWAEFDAQFAAIMAQTGVATTLNSAQTFNDELSKFERVSTPEWRGLWQGWTRRHETLPLCK
ncbi:hypothetical protein GCM10011342_15790 [Aquisalinus flavus]|uniref:Uncharacterized protein n=2 Tax=Aquisalinus flavus TaxID=1526572 RepID=A0A8J2V1I7_9PROT|nr:hypothetical protein [Aquisalinus flavus]MBD0426457.1 hypothetical protein [Aquisalinus flavus]GGD07751.1 hypothetical protein GCM10011342_15790 [Aquisalinus flavus]